MEYTKNDIKRAEKSGVCLNCGFGIDNDFQEGLCSGCIKLKDNEGITS